MERVAAVLAGAGDRAVIARAVDLRGFGSRQPGEVAVVTADGVVTGSLLGGAADARLVEEAVGLLAGPPDARLVDVAIGEPEAVEAGLACGGTARLFVQDARLIPAAWWDAVAERRPAALVSGPGATSATVVDPAPVDSAATGAAADSARRIDIESTPTGPGETRARELLGAGVPAVEVIEGSDEIVEVWWPTPRLLVVGTAALADALSRQAALLGWEPRIDAATDPAAAVDGVGGLGAADAVVVLTHDPDVAIPVLAAALRPGPGYVGALGSRRTQADRRERLAAAGVDQVTIDRIHGPVGLDLGARTPEETALAICAEIVAHRRGRLPGSLKDSSGPIHR